MCSSSLWPAWHQKLPRATTGHRLLVTKAALLLLLLLLLQLLLLLLLLLAGAGLTCGVLAAGSMFFEPDAAGSPDAWQHKGST